MTNSCYPSCLCKATSKGKGVTTSKGSKNRQNNTSKSTYDPYKEQQWDPMVPMIPMVPDLKKGRLLFFLTFFYWNKLVQSKKKDH